MIKSNYYPYVYIHEIVGDSFVLLLNADWAYKIPDYCTTICMNFLIELNERTEHLIQFRVGCAYGKILYGYIGDQLRLFGDTINLASRLEHISKIDHVYCDENFFEKLKSELASNNKELTCEKNIVELKGFKPQNAYLLEFNKYFKYNNVQRRKSILNM